MSFVLILIALYMLFEHDNFWLFILLFFIACSI